MMSIYIYICVNIYIYIHIHIHILVHIHMHIYIYTHMQCIYIYVVCSMQWSFSPHLPKKTWPKCYTWRPYGSTSELRSISVSCFGRHWNYRPIFAAFVLGLGSTALAQFFVKRFRLGQPLGQMQHGNAALCGAKMINTEESRHHNASKSWESPRVLLLVL